MELDRQASKSVQSDQKRYLAQNVAVIFSDFTKPFDIHTDASDFQLDAVISQNEKPIAFYSKTINPAQTRYTTTEKDLFEKH